VDAQDLIAVVADLDAKQAVEGILRRPESLRIRPVQFRVDRYEKRDAGCYRSSHDYLRPAIGWFDHAIVIFDRHGSGRESESREEIEAAVEHQLAINGWKGRSAAIVCDPELEIWVWSDSPEVDEVLGWRGKQPALREWLVAEGHCDAEAAKPSDPNEAMRQSLRAVGKTPSASQFRDLAGRVGFERCTDPAFLKFKQTLQSWFGQQ
jgi:hypothetical protein